MAAAKAGREVLFDVERAYVPPTTREQGARARAELRGALAALRRDGWVRALTGWGLARARGGREEVISPFNVHQVDAGELEVVGWTLTGALRAHCTDTLGNHYAEKYLAKVCPCDVAHWNNHPHVDQLDALRLMQKALQLASSDAGVTDITERPARGAAAPSATPRRVRSGSR